MLDRIDSDDITVQVESSKLDREVPAGVAISQGIHDFGAYEGSSATFTEMGMIKNGNLTGLGNTWVNVPNWTANSAYPGTVITSNALVLAQSAQVAITLRAAFGNGWFTSKITSYMRILVNGAVVKESSGDDLNLLRVVINANAGDAISLQVKMTSWNIGGNYLQGSNTWMKVKLNKRGALDFETDLMWPDKTEFISTGDIRYVVPPGKLKGRKSIWRTFSEAHSRISDGETVSSYKEWSGMTVGPVITQSKVPISVSAGMTVGMSGRFSVRGVSPTTSPSTEGDGGQKNELDQSTKGIIRFSLWGRGVVKDEYGVEVITNIELMFYEALLSTSGFTLVDISGVPEATIPAGITDVVFTASAMYETGGNYGTFDWEFEGSNKAWKVQYFGIYEDAYPLIITTNLPSSVNKTYVHSLSKTGVAFKNRALFTNVQSAANVVFFGYPGGTTSINIYNWNGSRGTLIGTYSTTANERKTISITPTGTTSIEIVKAGSNDFFIESVTNNAGSNLTSYWNQIEQVSFANINDDISRVSILREEGDKSTATIDFATSTLDPYTSATLKPGKVVRILGRHYGVGEDTEPSGWTGEAEYGVLFQGIIKRVTSEYSYDDEPIVQCTVYDAHDSIERLSTGIVNDDMMEYGPYFNRVGVPVLYNGIDWGGKAKSTFVNGFAFRPSSYGDMSFADSLSMTRNAKKSFYYIDRFNRLNVKDTLSSSTALVLTDGTAAGDISYGNIKRGSDTDTVINKVSVQEYLLDRKDIVEKTLGGGEEPPLSIEYVASRQQTAVFRNVDSINSYGEFEKSFDVVRGNGDLVDLYRGLIGTSFETWAQDILDERSEPTLNVSSLSIPMKSSDQIRMVSNLELLDQVQIYYKTTSSLHRIKEIEHTIIPGKWFVDIRFNAKGDMTFWS